MEQLSNRVRSRIISIASGIYWQAIQDEYRITLQRPLSKDEMKYFNKKTVKITTENYGFTATGVSFATIKITDEEKFLYFLMTAEE